MSETRFHYVCSCGGLGPDRGRSTYSSRPLLTAEAEARRDHKLHAEGRDPEITQGDPEKLPGAPYRAPDQEGK